MGKISVNWDDELPNIWEHKKCSKPPTSFLTGVFLLCSLFCTVLALSAVKNNVLTGTNLPAKSGISVQLTHANFKLAAVMQANKTSCH